MEAIEQLQQLGFSQYEAKAYVTLLRDNPLNGYELARESGIPRPNIYAVLHKLEESGAVLRLVTKEYTRYVPVPAVELLEKLKSRYQDTLEATSTSLQAISSPPQVEAILNFRGYTGLIEEARALLERTRDSLLLSIWPEEAQTLGDDVQKCAERGVEVTTLCLHGCAHPCPTCHGAVYRYSLFPEREMRCLLLVSDETELLAGEIQTTAVGSSTASSDCDASAIRTHQQMLIHLTGSYIRNSIALASILTGLGRRLPEEMGEQAFATIDNLRLFQTQESWLEEMRHMLRLEGSTA